MTLLRDGCMLAKKSIFRICVPIGMTKVDAAGTNAQKVVVLDKTILCEEMKWGIFICYYCIQHTTHKCRGPSATSRS